MPPKIHAWIKQFTAQAKKKWWIWFLLVLWALAQDRLISKVNHYLDTKSGEFFEFLRAMLSSPGALYFALVTGVVLALIVHAYFTARIARGPVPLYRAYHPQTGAHFYTTDTAERDNATNNLGYVAEQIACYIFGSESPGTIPLYRAFRGTNKDHFYTTNKAEFNNAVRNEGYVREEIAGYVCPTATTGTVPFHRLFKGTHFYTTSSDERETAIRILKFSDEKIECYVFPPSLLNG